jgi:hypothetical protein
VLLQQRGQGRAIVALRQRFFGRDDAVFRQLEQTVVQEAHALLATGLHDRRDLEDLGFADQVRNRR